MRIVSKVIVVLLQLVLFLPLYAQAMQPLDDVNLSGINARDGITLTMGSNAGIEAQQLNWVTDSGVAAAGQCSGGVVDQHACTLFNDISLQGVGGPIEVTAALDVGADGLGHAYTSL